MMLSRLGVISTRSIDEFWEVSKDRERGREVQKQ